MLTFVDWHNAQNPNDVDLNGLVEPHDAFVQISVIRTLPGHSVTIAAFSLPPNAKVNTNNDEFFNANDIYPVINEVGDPNNEIADELAVTLLTVSLGTPASITENETEVLALPATNAENEPLTHTITGGVDAAHFEISAGTNTLCFITPPDFDFPTDADGNNVYQVEVTADNGAGDLDPTLFEVTVVDDVEDNPPVFVTPADLTIPENSTFVRELVATDPSGDTVTFSISGGNEAQLFTIPASTDQLRFVAAPNYETPTDTFLANQYEVEVRADDGNGHFTKKMFTVRVMNVNEAPTINVGGDITIGPDRTTAPKANWIKMVAAADPDSTDTRTFSIEDGNGEGIFAVNANTGDITLASELWTTTSTVFVLRLRVTDGGGLFSENELTITRKDTTVAIAGDTQAIEIAGDNIRLRFIRLSSDNSAPLTVSFVVDWSSPAGSNPLSASDFSDGPGKAILVGGSITIQANEDEATIELVPNLDGDSSEGLERALITLVPGDDYAVPRSGLDPIDPEKKGLWLSFRTDLQVLDKVTLFAAGTPSAPDAAAVDKNDVVQGCFGDCYFMAVLLHLAQYYPAVIHNSVRENTDTAAPHDYKVRFFNAQNQPYEVDVTVDLTRGTAAARLSGDHDENGIEIWTTVLEQAYAQIHGGYNAIGDGGDSDEVWRVLTGRNAAGESLSDTTDEQILQKIRDALEDEKRVFLGTPSNAIDLVGRHVYSVDAAGPDTLTLHDPIDPSRVTTISIYRLDENFSSLYIADAP